MQRSLKNCIIATKRQLESRTEIAQHRKEQRMLLLTRCCQRQSLIPVRLNIRLLQNEKFNLTLIQTMCAVLIAIEKNYEVPEQERGNSAGLETPSRYLFYFKCI